MIAMFWLCRVYLHKRRTCCRLNHKETPQSYLKGCNLIEKILKTILKNISCRPY